MKNEKKVFETPEKLATEQKKVRFSLYQPEEDFNKFIGFVLKLARAMPAGYSNSTLDYLWSELLENGRQYHLHPPKRTFWELFVHLTPSGRKREEDLSTLRRRCGVLENAIVGLGS